jgi:hypothetical protein
MTQVIIGAFPGPQAVDEVRSELQEAGAAMDDVSVLDHRTAGKTADSVVDILVTLGLPDKAIIRYAVIIDHGGVCLSVKDTILSEHEISQCLKRHKAVAINLLSQEK